MTTTINTKFGTAYLNKDGYYTLSTNQGKYSRGLHRRIWEDYYHRTIPKNCVIHHLNGDKTDNRIQNLQCCTQRNHSKFHNTGKTFNHTEEFKKRRGEMYSGSANPMYGRKRSKDEMKGLIQANIKSSKLSYYDDYCGLVYLMHRKHAGLTQRKIIEEIGFNSCGYISQKLKRLNLSWGDL